jgi:hypothetical protein
MRRSADRLAAILAATLVMGCNPEIPESPPLPPKEPAGPRVNSRPDSKGDLRATLKKKEPGLGKAIPRANTRPNPAL